MTIPKSISEDDKLLSTSDAARMLDVHRSTVHLWIKDGALKTERRGKTGTFHAIRTSELKRFAKLYGLEINQGDTK